MTPLPAELLERPIAHRALHDVSDGRPENSRSAIRAAIAHGYCIEIDLQLSADGQAMVFHDYELSRLTEASGPVAAQPADALRKIALTGGQEGIPTLHDVLDLVAGQVPLLIEIKDQDGAMGANVGPLEEVTTRAIADYAGPVALMSFNPHSVRRMADMNPDIALGLTTSAFNPLGWKPLPVRVCDRLREIPDFGHSGASFISHEAKDLQRPRVQALRAAGVPVLCWTIKSRAAEIRARRYADNVTFEGYLA